MNDKILIRGARANNLKNVDIEIPLRKLTCFMGPSGSGKTSLAFHTLLSESKRRLINSFPNSLKFFTERPTAVDVDLIHPVLPAFGLPQINPVLGARSTVLDIMRLTEELQKLYFNYSRQLCPTHKIPLIKLKLIDQLRSEMEKKNLKIMHLFFKKDEALEFFKDAISPSRSLDNKNQIRLFNEEDKYWEVLKLGEKTQIDQAFADKLSEYSFYIWTPEIKTPKLFKVLTGFHCPENDYSENDKRLNLGHFSPYNAQGACPDCSGYGANLVYTEKKMYDFSKSVNEEGLKFLQYKTFSFDFDQLKKIMKKNKWSLDVPLKELPREFLTILREGSGKYCGSHELTKYLDSKKYKVSVRVFIRHYQEEILCQSCKGTRYNSKIEDFFLKFENQYLSLFDLAKMPIHDLEKIFELNEAQSHLEKMLRNNIHYSLKLSREMGLGHLQVNRKAKTLSSGEYQRLLLIKYLSYKGTDSLFILDEPSMGLTDTEKFTMLTGLRSLINQGNTVIVIDHSKYVQDRSDYWIHMGPNSGNSGGEVIYQGKPIIKKEDTFETSPNIVIDKNSKNIQVIGTVLYNRRYPDFTIPSHQLIWIHGESGTGKTTCIVNTLADFYYYKIYHEHLVNEPGSYSRISSIEKFEDVIVVNSNLNRFTSRSTVGTMTELSPVLRRHFLKLPISKRLNLKDGHFSSNSELGMCPRCEGSGKITIEMQYLEDIELVCEDCDGKKIKKIYANISDGKMTLSQYLGAPLSQILNEIDLTPKFKKVKEYLKLLHLDYLSLDRKLNSLSGGEKQRIYLLSKLLTHPKNALIIFENLSFGLSIKELNNLKDLLHSLVLQGNTVIVIDSETYFKNIASYELIFSAAEIKPQKLT